MWGGRTPDGFQRWIDACKRHRLSHWQVQIARELGLNRRKLSKLDNHRQEPLKLPLPTFIEQLYRERFGKNRPDVVLSLEDRVRLHEQKKRSGVPFEGSPQDNHINSGATSTGLR
jgi:hypothetical protein